LKHVYFGEDEKFRIRIFNFSKNIKYLSILKYVNIFIIAKYYLYL